MQWCMTIQSAPGGIVPLRYAMAIGSSVKKRIALIRLWTILRSALPKIAAKPIPAKRMDVPAAQSRAANPGSSFASEEVIVMSLGTVGTPRFLAKPTWMPVETNNPVAAAKAVVDKLLRVLSFIRIASILRGVRTPNSQQRADS